MVQIGGQAVIEGVLYRKENVIAIAVRTSNKKIAIKRVKVSAVPAKAIPILRGLATIWHMLKFGVKALAWSAQKQGEKISGKEIGAAFVFAAALAIGLFVLLPYAIAKIAFGKGFWMHFWDGIFRIAAILLYIFVVGQFKDAKRLLQYHGAEHKVANCYEAGERLTVARAMAFPKEHLRCGTSFLFIVLFLAIFVFSILRTEHAIANIALRLVGIPILAGLCYELFYAYSKTGSQILKIALLPGLAFQLLTTAEPSKDQIKVALAALRALREKRKMLK